MHTPHSLVSTYFNPWQSEKRAQALWLKPQTSGYMETVRLNTRLGEPGEGRSHMAHLDLCSALAPRRNLVKSPGSNQCCRCHSFHADVDILLALVCPIQKVLVEIRKHHSCTHKQCVSCCLAHGFDTLHCSDSMATIYAVPMLLVTANG